MSDPQFIFLIHNYKQNKKDKFYICTFSNLNKHKVKLCHKIKIFKKFPIHWIFLQFGLIDKRFY